jgi:gluconate 2-dehydrogenase gamma chain
MSLDSASRRVFLKTSAGVACGGWLAAHGALVFAAAETARQAINSQAALINLHEADALTLSALIDQIFPPDDRPREDPGYEPGASELGAAHFIDAALGGFMAAQLPAIQKGLANLDQRAGSSTAFHQLNFDQQTGIVRQIEDTDFFRTVHFLTLCGLFALPAYGGNSNSAGWKMIGFEPRHVWQAPFGFYDAQYAQEHDRASS